MERLKKEREGKKKKIKEKIPKDLEDIGIWNNICSRCLPITFLGLSFKNCIS
jgi:hypothetical protein